MEYKIKEITPKSMQCAGAFGCPAIYDIGEKYGIVGKIEDAKKYGLEKKIGEEECLIVVDKKLIDEKQD